MTTARVSTGERREIGRTMAATAITRGSTRGATSGDPGRGSSRGTVPVGRRLLLADRRRLVASVTGVGLALMLILLLGGLSAGIDERITVFEQRAGAALYVAQPGTTSFLGSTSVLPREVLDTVRATPGVGWAAPVRGFFTVPQLGEARVPAYVVGGEAGSPGGPWDLREGRGPQADDEVAVGQQFAARGSLAVGDEVSLFGRAFRIVGIAGDADMFMASFVFMTHAATDALLQSPTTTSFVLVGTDDPQAVAPLLRDAGLNVLTRAELERNDLALKGQAYDAGLRVVVMIAFLVGVLVIAMTVYSAVVERRRDYGIVRAVGATGWRLFRLVLGQSLALASFGLVAGGVFFVLGAAVLGQLRPQFAISLSTAAVVQVVVVTVLMGVIASTVPARRLATIEPASAFRGC